ncbi:hypothetical protein ASD79_13790 [Caulobacter sp. Root655]|nr:hypothetical protein ASD79_13790 [Caulobacter sp. Root655]
MARKECLVVDVLMVLTSHGRPPDGGGGCGLSFDQFLSPYYLFVTAGIDVALASPRGGPPPLDPGMDQREADPVLAARFRSDNAARDLLADTLKLSQVAPEDFAAVLYPGGLGALFDLPADPVSQGLIEAFARAGRPMGFIGHAPAVLAGLRRPDGAPFVAGRRLTALSDREGWGTGAAPAPAWSAEQVLRGLGADYRCGPEGRSHLVRDGLLVTGQNTASAPGVARELMTLMA